MVALEKYHGVGWGMVREAISNLSEVEKIVTRLYYGIPATVDSQEPPEAMALGAVVDELQKLGINLSYEQAKEKLKKARRLLGVMLLPYQEALERD